MIEQQEFFSPLQLAQMYNIHSNTVRLYEHLGYISPAERTSKNYRIFTQLHVLQVEICRCIFGYPFFNKKIRTAGNKLLISSGKKQWNSCLIFTNEYIKVIEHEINIATETANILEKWATKKESTQIITHVKSLSRKQVADYFQITVETVRNWERNNLINSCEKGALGEALYSSQMLEKITIIYMLRQAGYSMVSIHNSLEKYNHGDLDEIISALNVPYDSDVISVGDKWLYELNKLYNIAQNIPVIIKKILSEVALH